MSLFKVNYKIPPNVFTTKVKKILPVLFSHEQTTYVQGRFTYETCRLLYHIIEVTNSLMVFSNQGYWGGL